MTIEDLAIITQKGFKELERKIDRGFGEVNERLDSLDKTRTNHDNRIENLEDRVRVVETSLEK